MEEGTASLIGKGTSTSCKHGLEPVLMPKITQFEMAREYIFRTASQTPGIIAASRSAGAPFLTAG